MAIEAGAMASSLSSALSSMEVMLDALMQRGIGKPEEKPKEEAPPALPSRPKVRGRLPSLQKPGSPPPWLHRVPPPPSPPLPPPQEEEEDKWLVNLELERRAVKAEEEAKQKEEEAKKREEEIAALRQQVEHYESRLSECEVRMKSVEEELQKQITALQAAQSAAAAGTGGSSSTTRHRREASGFGAAAQSPATRAEEALVSRPRGCEPAADERPPEVSRLAKEFRHQSQAFEHGARAVAVEARPPSARSVDELKKLKRQFGAWRKEYEARLRKTKAELKKLVHKEKSHRQGHGQPSRCSWWRRIKAPKCNVPKCCTFNLPSCSFCRFCCCFRFRHCC